jgi:hypothetical protein
MRGSVDRDGCARLMQDNRGRVGCAGMLVGLRTFLAVTFAGSTRTYRVPERTGPLDQLGRVSAV